MRRGDGQILAVVAVQDGQAAHDLMVAPGQAAQHGKGLALGVGLAHDERIAHHDGVGRDDDVVRHAVRLHGLRLFKADAGDLIGGMTEGVHGLVGVYGTDREFQAHALEQLFPPRGFGCEIDLHGKYLFYIKF